MDALTGFKFAKDSTWHDAVVAYLAKHAIVDGRDVIAGNTGMSYNAIDPDSLTVVSGPQNITTDGQVISGKKFDSQVAINADNVVMRNCMFEGGGDDTIGLNIFGSHFQGEGINVHAADGLSWYIGVQIVDDAVGTVLTGVDLNGCENNLTNYGTQGLVRYSYIHDASVAGKVDAHADNIEVYGGSIEFDRCNLPMGALKEDACINIAPFGGRVVTGVDVHDCFADGGQAIIIAGADMPVTNVKIRRNFLGGHQNPDEDESFGIYMAASYWQDHGLCETEAEQIASGGVKILWSSSGPDANHWWACEDLDPDNTGEVANPRA